MSATTLGVLIAGFGGIATQDHQNSMYVPAFLAHDGFNVLGAVDVPGTTGAELASGRYEIPYLTDLDEALADDRVEVVSIAAPLERRAEIVGRAIRAGKHVLGDKPLAASLAETQDLARQSEMHRTVLVPAHHQRLHGVLRSARTELKAGRIGLPWNIQADFFVAGGKTAPTGELMNLALYPIDVVHSLLGLDVLRVYACSGKYWNEAQADFVTLLLDHENGVTSTIVCGRTASMHDVPPAGLAVHRYRMSGSHGVILTDATKPTLTVRTSQTRRTKWSGPNTVDLLVDVLHRGIVTGRPEISASDAIYTQRIIEAAQRSLDSGVPVQLETTKKVN